MQPLTSPNVYFQLFSKIFRRYSPYENENITEKKFDPDRKQSRVSRVRGRQELFTFPRYMLNTLNRKRNAPVD